MTNKVKPFYIRITDDMTPQMVQDAFDKCVDAGADACEGVECTDKRHRYQDAYDIRFNHFGVDVDGATMLYDNHENYGIDTQEITLDQLDEWLGLEVEIKWEVLHGEQWIPCIRLGKDIYGHHAYQLSGGEFMGEFNGTPNLSDFRKPETPEQKAERERLEAAYDLYCYAKKESVYSCVIVSFKEFIGDFFTREREEYLAIVDKTNYRKK